VVEAPEMYLVLTFCAAVAAPLVVGTTYYLMTLAWEVLDWLLAGSSTPDFLLAEPELALDKLDVEPRLNLEELVKQCVQGREGEPRELSGHFLKER